MQNFGALANIVRQSVSALQVGTDLGLAPGRDGKCRCIFHGDKNPSMKLYNGTGGYYCFVCHAHGDVIDLTAEVLHRYKPAALQWINEQYGLGLPIGGNHDPDAMRKAREEADRRAREVEAVRSQTEALNRAVEAAYRIWMNWKSAVDSTRPSDPENGISYEFALCVWCEEMARENYQLAQDELYAWNLSQLEHKTAVRQPEHSATAVRAGPKGVMCGGHNVVGDPVHQGRLQHG